MRCSRCLRKQQSNKTASGLTAKDFHSTWVEPPTDCNQKQTSFTILTQEDNSTHSNVVVFSTGKRNVENPYGLVPPWLIPELQPPNSTLCVPCTTDPLQQLILISNSKSSIPRSSVNSILSGRFLQLTTFNNIVLISTWQYLTNSSTIFI